MVSRSPLGFEDNSHRVNGVYSVDVKQKESRRMNVRNAESRTEFNECMNNRPIITRYGIRNISIETKTKMLVYSRNVKCFLLKYN